MEIRDRTTFLDYLASTHTRTRRRLPLIPRADFDWAPKPGVTVAASHALARCARPAPSFAP